MKAVIIGGSNGLGLAICKELEQKGYFLEICDLVEPEEGVLSKECYKYHYLDLYDLDNELVQTLSEDEDINLLMITAGIGRVADFQYHHIAEIKKILTINAMSPLQIFRVFYNRILNSNTFYAGIISSISGRIISPSTSVYASAKASIVRFVESVNIELEAYGSNNRILDVSPASFKGSRFYGEENDISLIKGLALDIINHLFAQETIFIPQYEEVLKDVINYYNENPHEYGLHSLTYKKNSGRLDNTCRAKIGYLSGTFDLFHIGHLNLLKRAKKQCDYLIVGVHSSGAWKGKETFIPFEERRQIVASCKYVDKAVESFPEDSDAWNIWHFDKLFVGSDYIGTERFLRYEAFFADKNVDIVYFPYTQSTSSTMIREKIHRNSIDI